MRRRFKFVVRHALALKTCIISLRGYKKPSTIASTPAKIETLEMELRVIESLHPAEAEEYKSDVMSKSIIYVFTFIKPLYLLFILRIVLIAH